MGPLVGVFSMRVSRICLPAISFGVFVVAGLCVPLLAGATTARPNVSASATSFPIPTAPATTFPVYPATTTTAVTGAAGAPCGPSSAHGSLASIDANAGSAVITVNLTATSGCSLPTSPGAAFVPVAATTVSPATPVLQAQPPPGGAVQAGADVPARHRQRFRGGPYSAPGEMSRGSALYLQIAMNEPPAGQSLSAPLMQAVQVQLPAGRVNIPEFLRYTGAPSLISVSAQPPASTAAPACASTNLQAAVLPGPGGAGNVALTIALTNISSGTCTLNGYPAVQLYDSAGTPLVTDQQNGAQTWMGPSAAYAPVTLAPQGAVSFDMTARDIGGAAPCTVGQEMSVTPPGTSTALTFPVVAAACNGVITISGYQPGETALQ